MIYYYYLITHMPLIFKHTHTHTSFVMLIKGPNLKELGLTRAVLSHRIQNENLAFKLEDMTHLGF